MRLFSILEINKTKHLNQLERTSARLADVYRRQNKLEQADDLYREAITMIIANEHHNSMFLAKAEYAHGLVLFQENKFKEAQAVLTNALSIVIDEEAEKGELVAPIRKKLNEIRFRLDPWGYLLSKLTKDST